MKPIAVLCVLVVAVSAAPYSSAPGFVRVDSGYGGQRFLEEGPQVTRVIESTPAIRVAEHIPLRVESYGQRHLMEVPAPVRILERPSAIRVLKQDIPITKFNHVINPNANAYSVDFEGGNGVHSQESGFLKGVGVSRLVSEGRSYGGSYGYGNEVTRLEEVVQAVQAKSGETTWCSPEGKLFTLTYTADEQGYRPTLQEGLCTPSVAAVPVRELAYPTRVASLY